MIYKKYCFVGPCYVGIMTINTQNDTYAMKWENENNYTEGACNYKKYMKLDSSEQIKIWISERVISRDRPDASVWLGLVGLTPKASDLEIFLNIHGVSCNDTFWFNDSKDNRLWTEQLRYAYNV